MARGATLRRQIGNVPARLARPQRRPVLHLPARWPWAQPWLAIWNRVFQQAQAPPAAARPVHRRAGTTGEPNVERLADQRHRCAVPAQSATAKPAADTRATGPPAPRLEADGSRLMQVRPVTVSAAGGFRLCGGERRSASGSATLTTASEPARTCRRLPDRA